jgi:hypothetical protein
MTLTWLAFASIGVILASLAVAARLLSRRHGRRVACIGLAAASLLGLAAFPFALGAAYLAACFAQGQPAPETRVLAPGVTYTRVVLSSPRPIVAHVVAIDLDRGIRLEATAPTMTPDGPRAAALTPRVRSSPSISTWPSTPASSTPSARPTPSISALTRANSSGPSAPRSAQANHSTVLHPAGSLSGPTPAARSAWAPRRPTPPSPSVALVGC